MNRLNRKLQARQLRKNEALACFIDNKHSIDALLTRIQSASDDHFFTHPDAVTWAHNGDLEHIKTRLQDVVDSIYGTGEYAEVA